MVYQFEDEIFEKLLNLLKVDDRVVVTSQLFHEFKTNEERVGLAYELLEEENLLPTNSNFVQKQKTQKLANELRNEGNKAFQMKRDLEALQFYNRSLAAAPIHSKEFALALANRSAVNIALGFYEACLSDIELALKNGYPYDLRLKLLERKVKCMINLLRKEDAVRALMEVQEYLEKTLSVLSDEKRISQELGIKGLQEEIGKLDSSLDSCGAGGSRFGCRECPHVSYGKNQEIECASDCIKLMFSENLGRYIVASRDIAPGDVLIVEQPYASVLLPDAYANHCFHCQKRSLSPIPCLKCTQVLYCDETCRDISWEQYHSLDCDLLPLLTGSVGKMSLLALRVLLISTKKGNDLLKLYSEEQSLESPHDQRVVGFNKEGVYKSTDYWPIHFLVGHSDKRAVADLFRRSVIAACLLYCLEQHTDFFSASDYDLRVFAGGLLLRHLQSLPCNAHEVSEMFISSGRYESQEIGAAAYATLSLLNHSCDPNVVRHSYKDWAVLRAIRPIKTGEEVVDNYGYHHALLELSERRTQLSKQYFFHCSCTACQGCWPLYKDQPKERPVYRCNGCGTALATLPQEGIVSCTGCQKSTNKAEVEVQLKKSSALFREQLLQVLEGQQQDSVLRNFLNHLALLDKNVLRPWREFSECQEAIKQCLSLQANHIILGQR